MEDNQIGFNSLTPFERLDKVLNIIYERGPLSLNEITHRELRLLKKITATQIDIERVIDRLIDDKYIKIEPVHANYPNYKITFEGELLLQRKGYQEKEKREKEQTRLQSMQTFAIWVGSAIAGIYYFVELVRWVVSLGV